MKILDIQQNTPEWEELRRSKIGASDIATLMTGSKAEIYQLYLAKVSGKKKFVTDSMKRGSDMEAEARRWFNLSKDFAFYPAVCLSDDHDWLMASFDGFDNTNKMSIEIKCPKDVFEDLKEHPSYKRWWWQVQAQYAVGGHNDAVLLAYDPERQSYMHIERDEKAIERLIKVGEEFYDRMINYDAPEGVIVERDDEPAKAAMAKWRKAYLDRVLAEKEEEVCKQALIDLADGVPFRCQEVSVVRQFRRGAVEYKRIVELKDIDLERYRKPGIEFWKIG